MYDKSNPFYKILHNELPCKKVYEDEMNLAFHSNEPKAPVHVLVIPKGFYIDFEDFTQNASDAEAVSLNKAIVETAKVLGLVNGYRLIVNKGKDSGMTVPHLHYHIIGNKKMDDNSITKGSDIKSR